MQVQPYLMFEGRCDEAIEFYKRALGAEVTALMRMKEAPGMPPGLPAGSENKVMHSAMKIGGSEIMASDGMCSGKPNFEGVSMSITGIDDAEAEKYFKALSDGGQVKMPIAKTFFASRFGMVADRFGVTWMVVSAPVM